MRSGNGEAIVSIGISDHDYYPLHQGATVQERWGSTIGNGTRRLDLVPGPASAPVIRSGGIIQTQDTTSAVNLDSVLNVFTQRTRKHLTRMLGDLGAGIKGESAALHSGLNSAPAAFTAANGVLSDLASNTYALQSLIVNGDRLTATLASRAPAISDLVTVAGRTFTALSENAAGLQQSIADLPGALTETRGTLARLDTSVGTLTTLITDLRPGAAQLSPAGGGDAPGAVRAAEHRADGGGDAHAGDRRSARDHQAAEAGGALDAEGPVGQLAARADGRVHPAVRAGARECDRRGEQLDLYVRTREAECGASGVTFSGARQGPYVQQHGVRAMVQASAASLHAYPPGTISTKTFTQLAGKQYAEPRPPGLSVGQPWYQPQCGAGPSSLNPSDDPESRP